MPPPQTGNEVLELFFKSGIVGIAEPDPALRNRVQQLAVTSSPADTLRPLVLAGILTQWQADQLLQGKYKRFRLGKYLILEPLNSIGDGVYLAVRGPIRRRVTIQILPPPPNPDERCGGVMSWWSLGDHPNIVRWFDCDQDENLTYSVCESLGTHFPVLLERAGGRLPIGEACGCAIQIAKGLHAVHETKPIWETKTITKHIYGGINPSNLFVWENGTVKIPNPWWFEAFEDVKLAAAQTAFAAPELSDAPASMDYRCDCYSLGAVLLHMIGDGGDRMPKELADVVAKMMAKTPEERYQSMAEVIAALRPFVEPAPPGICPPMAAAALE